ncbi:hypothetical protein MKW98_017926 [Papaver atlanticum]|uniref:Uncharacterized protein n=1 Tax=Papaver atlanticum TaxID=357466 RepID=A0AAD4TF01_9MAGN|nr:hypothetical protein MKW98_017926 [Papaver atlanticum]
MSKISKNLKYRNAQMLTWDEFTFAGSGSFYILLCLKGAHVPKKQSGADTFLCLEVQVIFFNSVLVVFFVH